MSKEFLDICNRIVDVILKSLYQHQYVSCNLDLFRQLTSCQIICVNCELLWRTTTDVQIIANSNSKLYTLVTRLL
jgi:hypothetical protein